MPRNKLTLLSVVSESGYRFKIPDTFYCSASQSFACSSVSNSVSFFPVNFTIELYKICFRAVMPHGRRDHIKLVARHVFLHVRSHFIVEMGLVKFVSV